MDSTDNITGIPGIGEVKATNILKDVPVEEMKKVVLDKYCEYYKSDIIGAYNFQKNLRQVYLLRTKEDFINEIGEVPDIGDPILIEFK